MKNSELIEYVARDLLDDRTDMLSGESDEVHSDDKIARFLAEAENIMCRRAWVLEDAAASAVTRIQLVEGKNEYRLDKSVLHVKYVRLSDSDVDLCRAGYETARPRGYMTHPDGAWDVNYPYIQTPGRAERYSLDIGVRTLRLDRKPDADAAMLKLHIAVVRMPLKPISASCPDASPEIPEELHSDLGLYAAGKCLALPTIDAESRTRGKELMSDFWAAVAAARLDRQIISHSEPRTYFGGWASS